MINRHLRRDFFVHGMLASIVWHFSWVLILLPVVKYPAVNVPTGRAIFLGSILNAGDLDLSGSKNSGQNKIYRMPLDLSRPDYFTKTLSMPQKPKAPPFSEVKRVFFDSPIINPGRKPLDTTSIVIFGIHDFARYLDNVDFAELKRVSMREELCEGVGLELMLGAGGVIHDVVKVSGSGDPVLDLYILRKFKAAIFKEFWPAGKPVRVYFKIKE